MVKKVATFKTQQIGIKTKNPNQVWSKSRLFDPTIQLG